MLIVGTLRLFSINCDFRADDERTQFHRSSNPLTKNRPLLYATWIVSGAMFGGPGLLWTVEFVATGNPRAHARQKRTSPNWWPRLASIADCWSIPYRVAWMGMRATTPWWRTAVNTLEQIGWAVAPLREAIREAAVLAALHSHLAACPSQCLRSGRTYGPLICRFCGAGQPDNFEFPWIPAFQYLGRAYALTAMGVRGASDIDGLGACRTNASLFTTIAHTNGMVDSGKVECRAKTQRPMRNWAHESYRIIPARLASTRLPRKMLRKIAGSRCLPGFIGEYAGVHRSTGVVATDSDEIMRFCEQNGFVARMTSPTHRSGTERVAMRSRRRFRLMSI